MESLFKKIFNQNPTSDEVGPEERGEFVKERVRGRIIKLFPTGYGFITSKEIPFTRIFFHWTALLHNTVNFADLTNGMEVEFNPYKLEGRGYRALRIEVFVKEHNNAEGT